MYPVHFLLMLSALVGAQSPCPNAIACRPDAALARLFTPGTAPKNTYHVYVTEAGIDKVAAAYRTVASSSDVEGAWVVRETEPLSAFGEVGAYDRSKVARLYLGTSARVARGPIIREGRTVAAITLVSPYPDASLTSMRSGTLIIEFRVPPTTSY